MLRICGTSGPCRPHCDVTRAPPAQLTRGAYQAAPARLLPCMNLLLTLAAIAVTYGLAWLLLSALARATEEREPEPRAEVQV